MSKALREQLFPREHAQRIMAYLHARMTHDGKHDYSYEGETYMVDTVAHIAYLCYLCSLAIARLVIYLLSRALALSSPLKLWENVLCTVAISLFILIVSGRVFLKHSKRN